MIWGKEDCQEMYRRDGNQLYIFANDSVPRWLTASYHIDFDTQERTSLVISKLDLENEAEELKNSNVNLQLENSELVERLETIKVFASFVLECPEVEEVRKLNHSLRH